MIMKGSLVGMDSFTRISDLASHESSVVTLGGWLHAKTGKGKLQFLQVRDGTGVVQCVVFKKDVSPQVFEAARAAKQESSLIVTGTVRADQRAPGTPGGYEIGVSDLQIVQLVNDEYPITPKEHGIEFLMQRRHLWIRSSRQWAVLRVRAQVVRAVQDWLDTAGFLRVDAPVLTSLACEGTTTLFETDYFGTPAYLSQSGQLYNEATIMAFGRVYCMGPTFRAEKSKTRRHLTEFWMVEPEMAFSDLEDCMQIAEQFVSYIVQHVLAHCWAELSLLDRDTSSLRLVVPPFPRISYDEALVIVAEVQQEEQDEGMRRQLDIEWGKDLGTPHQMAVVSRFNKPVFIHHFPIECKAFYMQPETDPRHMQPDGDEPKLCRSVDLFAPEGYGEVIGGGERIHDQGLLERRLEEHQLPKEAFQWYLDLRRFGTVQHSGFGLGIERTVMWLCGIEHIRETIAFPRLLERIHP
jgi:asparaginyl-tRNA synthetase